MNLSDPRLLIAFSFFFGFVRLGLLVGLLYTGYYYFTDDVRLPRALVGTGVALVLGIVTYLLLRKLGSMHAKSAA